MHILSIFLYNTWCGVAGSKNWRWPWSWSILIKNPLHFSRIQIEQIRNTLQTCLTTLECVPIYFQFHIRYCTNRLFTCFRCNSGICQYVEWFQNGSWTWIQLERNFSCKLVWISQLLQQILSNICVNGSS